MNSMIFHPVHFNTVTLLLTQNCTQNHTINMIQSMQDKYMYVYITICQEVDGVY